MFGCPMVLQKLHAWVVGGDTATSHVFSPSRTPRCCSGCPHLKSTHDCTNIGKICSFLVFFFHVRKLTFFSDPDFPLAIGKIFLCIRRHPAIDSKWI